MPHYSPFMNAASRSTSFPSHLNKSPETVKTADLRSFLRNIAMAGTSNEETAARTLLEEIDKLPKIDVLCALAAKWRHEGEFWSGVPEDAARQQCADDLLIVLGMDKDNFSMSPQVETKLLEDFKLEPHPSGADHEAKMDMDIKIMDHELESAPEVIGCKFYDVIHNPSRSRSIWGYSRWGQEIEERNWLDRLCKCGHRMGGHASPGPGACHEDRTCPCERWRPTNEFFSRASDTPVTVYGESTLHKILDVSRRIGEDWKGPCAHRQDDFRSCGYCMDLPAEEARRLAEGR